VLTPNPSAAYQIRLPVGSATQALNLPVFSRSQGVGNSLIWLSTVDNANHSTVIWPVDTNLWASGRSISLPGDVSIAVAEGDRLWTVGVDPSQPNQTLVTALASE
jgi:hypothetical protein